ncbi:hypothetical protein EGW08_010956 [Elysia chlorotica]|uniref:Apolipoprotein D n=1 Tax=Elysia chlorotica TaxID=188477 RepID=A0A433TI73_ELYCH|nr:hypothetical protein EGW08_010956 [Elysia chlorotica]
MKLTQYRQSLAAVDVALASLLVLIMMPSVDSIVVVENGRCPAVTGMPGFDVERYKGTWHEFKRFPAFFEIGLECTSATYTSGPGGLVNVNNRGLLRISLFGKKVDVSKSSITGIASVPNAQRPAELIALFGADLGGETGCTPNYIIQDTDYTNYSVVFSCVEALGYNIQFAWILTRCKGLKPDKLEELEANLAKAGVDVSNFEKVDQTGCPFN